LRVEQLLEAIKQLSPAELREFRKQFTAWQEQNGQQAADDPALLQAAHARLPVTAERRLKRLIAKSEQGTLTAKERADYQALAQQAERIDVMRVEALAELVRRRGQPAAVVREKIGWEDGADGP
jgi:hypothetical protein